MGRGRGGAGRKGRQNEGKAPQEGTGGTGFPSDPNTLKVVSKLGGSTGAVMVSDPATGVRYVRKTGSSEGHLREEINADAAYRNMGIDVPAYRLYETSRGPVKLAVFVPNTQELGDIKRSDPARYETVRRKVQENFVADAVMGNWDVGGLGMDNILVDGKNTPWRIDNGGSLRYRAQGAPKGGAWNTGVGEIWSLRDKARNPTSAALFGDMSFKEIGSQMVKVGKMKAKALKGITDPALRATLGARFDTVARMGAAAAKGATESEVRALGG